MSKRALIIGSDRDYCFVIKEFLELRELHTKVILNYRDGIDRLFYEKPDVTVLELIDQEPSPSLLGKIRESKDFEAVDLSGAPGPVTGSRQIILFDDKKHINSLFDFIKLHYSKRDTGDAPPDTENEGSLSTTFYPSLLLDIFVNKRSGTLSLYSESNLNIYFLKGLPVYAEGGDVETAIGRILLDRGKIDRGNYEKAVDIAENTKQKFGEVLFGMGITSPHELNSYVELQIEEKIIRGFYYIQGRYEFTSGGDFADRIVSHQIDLLKLIYEGVRRYIDTEGIEDRNPVVEVKPRLKSDINSLGLKPKELRFVQLLKPRANLKDILESSRLEKEETLKLVYFLTLFKLLSVPGLNTERIGRASMERRLRELEAKREAEGGSGKELLPEDRAVEEDKVYSPGTDNTEAPEPEFPGSATHAFSGAADTEERSNDISSEVESLFQSEYSPGAPGGSVIMTEHTDAESKTSEPYGQEPDTPDEPPEIVYEITEEDCTGAEYGGPPGAWGAEREKEDRESKIETKKEERIRDIGSDSGLKTGPEPADDEIKETGADTVGEASNLNGKDMEIDLDYEYRDKETPRSGLTENITSLFQPQDAEDSGGDPVTDIGSAIEREFKRQEPPGIDPDDKAHTEMPGEGHAPESVNGPSESFVERVGRLHSEIETKDHYEILGIAREASSGEIRDAYYKLVKNYHPDANPNADHDTKIKAEDIFTRITSAYETLSEPETRREYDSREELAELKTRAKYSYEAEMAFKKGLTLLVQRDYARAEKNIREAVTLSPDEPAYLGAYTWARYLASGDKNAILEESIKSLEKAIEMNEKIAENHYYLGSIYKNVNDLRKAEKYYQRAIEVEPDYIEAKRELRLIHTRRINNRNDKKDDKKFWSGLFKR